MSSFAILFADLPDPRAANTRHNLLEVVFIALMAVLCGAESCADMAEFGHAKRSLLQSLLKMPHGVPSHDTFSRVFRLLRKWALNLLRHHPNTASLRRKIKRAGWNDDFLLSLIAHMR